MSEVLSAQESDRKRVWQKTPVPNLLRYRPKGTYYLRARIGGKEPMMECLGTTKFPVARIKVMDRLRELRAGIPNGSAPETLNEALALVRAKAEADPGIKRSTLQNYRDELDGLKTGRPAAVPATLLAKLRSQELAAWWARAAAYYAPQRANRCLMFVRQALKLARRAGAMSRDPSEELKRVKVPRRQHELVTPAQFAQIVENVRTQGKANSEEAANWLAFAAYCGARPKEISEVLWKHVDMENRRITITGGKERTKNHDWRCVPMIPQMMELIERMKKDEDGSGRLFSIVKPRDALRNACDRLGFQRMRIYDVRHLFATVCNASGVDVPTFAGWLGHKDGGALAMRTYVHPHEEHSQRSAARVIFK